MTADYLYPKWASCVSILDCLFEPFDRLPCHTTLAKVLVVEADVDPDSRHVIVVDEVHRSEKCVVIAFIYLNLAMVPELEDCVWSSHL